jgi:hypothetical protein
MPVHFKSLMRDITADDDKYARLEINELYHWLNRSEIDHQ